jgi:hypothetical protein
MTNSLEVHKQWIEWSEHAQKARQKATRGQALVIFDLAADLRQAQEMLLGMWCGFDAIQIDDTWWEEAICATGDTTDLLLAWGLIEEHEEHKGWYRVAQKEGG